MKRIGVVEAHRELLAPLPEGTSLEVHPDGLSLYLANLEDPCAVVVLPHLQPPCDGLALARLLRLHQGLQAARLVVASPVASPELAERARLLGADALVAPRHLRRTVEELLCEA